MSERHRFKPGWYVEGDPDVISMRRWLALNPGRVASRLVNISDHGDQLADVIDITQRIDQANEPLPLFTHPRLQEFVNRFNLDRHKNDDSVWRRPDTDE